MGTMRALARAVPAAPLRSPTRAALAAVIIKAEEATQRLKAAEEAAKRARDMVKRAEAARAQAQIELTSAEKAAADQLAEAAKTGAAPRPSAVRYARTLMLDSDDGLVAARNATDITKLALSNAEAHFEAAQNELADAADAVIRAEAGTSLLRETEALQGQLIEKRVGLRYLLRYNLLSPTERQAALALLAREIPPVPGGVEYQNWQTHSANKPWTDFRESLKVDCDAVLPE